MADIDEQPRSDLTGADAIAKLADIADDATTCMFTSDPTAYPPHVTPMALQAVEDDGAVWFISSTESQRNADIARDPRVVLTIQNDKKLSYAACCGTATIHTDDATIDRHWTAFANAWFEGREDPRVSMIRVAVDEGHYWETENGRVVGLAKMLFAAATGKGDDAGVDGRLGIDGA